jgi:oxepin-CoA hydrolase/3-oxo-5,6-dehydrosuberyl-CoA semialdehyde dehydrogenase
MSTSFLKQDLFTHLKKLKADTVPEWGSMNAWEMVDHLRRGVLMSVSLEREEILSPPEQLPALKRFLMSDKPFPPNRKKPAAYDNKPAFDGDLEEAKEALSKEIENMLAFYEQNPNFTAVHPSFGELTTAEWLHLHKKHFTHHLTQFNLM